MRRIVAISLETLQSFIYKFVSVSVWHSCHFIWQNRRDHVRFQAIIVGTNHWWCCYYLFTHIWSIKCAQCVSLWIYFCVLVIFFFFRKHKLTAYKCYRVTYFWYSRLATASQCDGDGDGDDDVMSLVQCLFAFLVPFLVGDETDKYAHV